MKFSEFRQYRPKAAGNIFVFICEDDLLVEEARPIWAGILGEGWVFEKYHAKEFEDIESARLMDDARTASLFSQNRALIVINADKLTKRRTDDLEALHQVPNSTLKVILVSDSPKSAGGWMKAFPIVQIDRPKPGEAARWLVDRYQVDPEVARYLVESVGAELYPLRNEMEKLRTYVGEGRPVTARDVDALVLRSERFGTFELDDAILARDYRKTVAVAGAMLDDGIEPLVVLARIVRVWRQLFMSKGLIGKRSAKEIAATAMVPAWKAGDFINGCKKHEWKQLARGFRELLKADRALKTASPDPGAYFDVMLWKLLASSELES